MTIEFNQIGRITEKRIVVLNGEVVGKLTRYRPHGWLVSVRGFNANTHPGECRFDSLAEAKAAVIAHFNID